DRSHSDRRDDVRSRSDRRAGPADDKRNDLRTGERDAPAAPEDEGARSEANTVDDADTTDTVEATAETPDTTDNADTDTDAQNADAIAAAIDPAAADAAKTRPAPAVTAAPAPAAHAEIDPTATATADVELAIDTGKPAQLAPELLTKGTATDTEKTIVAAKANAETSTGTSDVSEDGTFEVALKAQQAPEPQDGEAAPDAGIKPAGGEAKPAAEAKPHHAAVAEKAADAPASLPANANANATQGPQNQAQHSQIHVPQVQHASAVAVAHAADASPVSRQGQAVPVEGLAVEIAARAQSGKNRFEIRLDPPELGRIEVRLDVDRHGHVTSRLVVERPETLDLLRRDAAGLERALQDAGLKTADNSLQFSLRDQTLNQQASHQSRDSAEVIVSDDTLPAEIMQRGYRSLAAARGGVDIRV
ncbi:MAG: flagellar hook-length control protein FliK, partial [Pseudolabrys sp.]